MLELVKTIDQIVAENLSMRIFDLDLDQKEVARLAGITPGHLNKLLNGKKSISKSPALRALASAVKCQEWELYQDDAKSRGLNAALTATEHSKADLKKLGKMLGDHLVEAMSDLSEAKSAISSIPPRAWAAWHSDKTPTKAKQLAELFLTRDKTILKDMDLSVGGLKAAEELLRWLHPPKPHPKD